MDTTFNFLTDPQLYTATLPDEYGSGRESACALVGDLGAHDTVFAEHRPAFADRTDLFTTTDQMGSVVDVYTTEWAPDTLIAEWRLDEGRLWTHSPAGANEVVVELLSRLSVTFTDAGLPFITASSPGLFGDIRHPYERDRVCYLGEDGVAVPWNVAVDRAGALASDGTFRDSDVVTVSIAAAGGTVVSCSGPLDSESIVRGVTEQVAESIVPV